MNLPPRLRSCLSLHFSPGWRRLAQPFTLPELDRAHRTLRARPTDGERPSPIIIHFQQRKLVLMITRKEGQLIYQGHRIFVFPDLSNALANKRSSFNPVKSRIFQRGMKVSLRHSALLCFTCQQRKLRFHTAEDVEKFFNLFYQSVGASVIFCAVVC